jgi:hypothetical protein
LAVILLINTQCHVNFTPPCVMQFEMEISIDSL